MVSSGVDSGGRVFTEVRLGPGDWRSAVDKGSGGLTVRHGNTSVLHQTEQVPVLGAGIALGHAVRGDSSAAKRAVASTTGERMVGTGWCFCFQPFAGVPTVSTSQLPCR